MVQLTGRALQVNNVVSFVTNDMFEASYCASATQNFTTTPYGSIHYNDFSARFNALQMSFTTNNLYYDVKVDADNVPGFACIVPNFPTVACSTIRRTMNLPPTLPTGTAVSGVSVSMYAICGAGVTIVTVEVKNISGTETVQTIPCADLNAQDGFNVLSTEPIEYVQLKHGEGTVADYFVYQVKLVSTICSTPSFMPSSLPTSMPTSTPSSMPSSFPTSMPTSTPSSMPSSTPSRKPKPTKKPSPKPVRNGNNGSMKSRLVGRMMMKKKKAV
jgi:cell division septation protein DedD